MAEIDLIPAEYTAKLARRRSNTVFAVSSGMAILIGMGLYAALVTMTVRVENQLIRLQDQKAITTQQRNALLEWNERLSALRDERHLLEGLRNGVSAERLFLAIDRALADEKVWFLDWKFSRAGAIVKVDKEKSKSRYLIELPRKGDTSDQRAYEIRNHMKVRGQAVDHAALSRFVENLLAEKEIQDVRVLKTSSTNTANKNRIVDFDIAVLVNMPIGTG